MIDIQVDFQSYKDVFKEAYQEAINRYGDPTLDSCTVSILRDATVCPWTEPDPANAKFIVHVNNFDTRDWNELSMLRFQINHEAMHVFSASSRLNCNHLEEGVCTYFARDLTSIQNSGTNSNALVENLKIYNNVPTEYVKGHHITISLFEKNNGWLKELRKFNKVISMIPFKALKETFNGDNVRDEDISFLVSKFYA